MKSVETRQTLKNAPDLHLPTAAAELDTVVEDDGASVLCLQLRETSSFLQLPYMEINRLVVYIDLPRLQKVAQTLLFPKEMLFFFLLTCLQNNIFGLFRNNKNNLI